MSKILISLSAAKLSKENKEKQQAFTAAFVDAGLKPEVGIAYGEHVIWAPYKHSKFSVSIENKKLTLVNSTDVDVALVSKPAANLAQLVSGLEKLLALADKHAIKMKEFKQLVSETLKQLKAEGIAFKADKVNSNYPAKYLGWLLTADFNKNSFYAEYLQTRGSVKPILYKNLQSTSDFVKAFKAIKSKINAISKTLPPPERAIVKSRR